MVLELHVWGPAFNLPSIDAHCLAAIAYLQQAVPRGEWLLIASSDATLSPTNELPALRNGDAWIGGFRNIFHYIAHYSAGKWVLDAGLPEQEEADCIAFSSFVESHGQPLLDLSLYVSTQNYTSTTRPLYNTIQPFPLQYLTPPSLRTAAKQRTAHLGLSSLDIDTEEGEPQDRSIIPESLRRPKSTVSSFLAASPETNAQIRLDALASAFFEPLQKILGKKNFFASEEQFSTLDCLVLGYLSLMLMPDLPQPWLARTMTRKFPKLCRWTEEMREKVFGNDVIIEDALTTESQEHEKKKGLPWRAPSNRDVITVSRVFLSSIADSVPVVGQLRRNTRMRQHGGKTLEDGAESLAWQRLATVGSLIAGAGLLVGYLFQQGIISLPSYEADEKRDNRTLGDLGEAGDFLSDYANQMSYQAQIQREMEGHPQGAPVAELDMEVEPGSVRRQDRVVVE